MINGYPKEIISKCEFYDDGDCECCGSSNIGSSSVCNCRCKNNPDCYYKKIVKLEKENDAFKNSYGVNCETCTSRIELNKIRDISNKLVPLKNTEVIIDRNDLVIDGIAFANVSQMKDYCLNAYRGRTEQVNKLKDKIAMYEGKTCYYCECGGTIRPEQKLAITKDVLQEVMKEIQQQLIKEVKDGTYRGR